MQIFSIASIGLLALACSRDETEVDHAPQKIWPRTDLVAVAMTGEARAVVVGHRGRIFVSTNAGESWQQSHVPVTTTLRGISMADEQNGWVVGDGVILRTDDGGKRWRRQRLPGREASMRLSSVAAIDADHGIAIGEGGIVLQTRDAGSAWQVAGLSATAPTESGAPNRKLACLRVADVRCWIAGAGLRRTQGDVETWRAQIPTDHARISPLPFERGQVDLAVGDAERFQAFVLANRTRADVEWIIEPRIHPREVESVSRLRDPSALFELIAARLQEVRDAIEAGSVPPERIQSLGEPPWDYEDYLDDDPRFLERYWERWATGKNVAPESGAESKVRVSLRVDHALYDVTVDPRGPGLAVGRSGAIVRSPDAGEAWLTVASPTPHDLLAVGLGQHRAVAVGSQGELWTSEDAGQRWEAVATSARTNRFEALRAVSFSPSGGTGLVVGDRGRVLRSPDGGRSWVELGDGEAGQASEAH